VSTVAAVFFFVAVFAAWQLPVWINALCAVRSVLVRTPLAVLATFLLGRHFLFLLGGALRAVLIAVFILICHNLIFIEVHLDR
jgi:hypothetical protein